VLYLLVLAFIGAVIWVTLHAVPLFLIGGLDWDDLRSVLLHRAYQSFTFEGDVIPGARPSAATRLVIRTLSSEDDARAALVTKAMAASPERRPPFDGKALQQARWFAAPPFGAQFRARSVAGARARGW